ncbi:type I secretion system permease/ATPase [Gallaecimonas sp. GXIMD4217]|uniref:type I secretion system permease/ATPase n=1 Tax=Gallaecimonas sp. GXIMD4217 TaxID=3131927 RepID=UPI00311AC936
MEAKTQAWSLGRAEQPDPLLDCLKWLLAKEGRPLSDQALLAGVPLGPEQRLDPDYFPRVASKGGLSARLVKLAQGQLDRYALPMLVLLKDRQAGILTEWGQVVRLYRPESGQVEDLSQEAFAELYQGYAFLLQQAGDGHAEQAPVDSRPGLFWRTLWQHKSLYRDCLIGSLVINLFALVVPLFSMNVYDRVVPNLAFDTLWVLAAGALTAFVFDGVLRLTRTRLLDLAGRQAEQKLAQVLMSKVLGQPLVNRPGSLGQALKRFQDFEYVREFITSSTLVLLIDLPFALLFLLIIAVIGGWVVVAPLLAALVLLGAAWLLAKPMHKTVLDSAELAAIRQGQLAEILAMPEFIKACGAEGRCQKTWELLTARLGLVQNQARDLQHRLSGLSNLMVQLTTITVVILGVYAIAEGEGSLGAIIATVMLSSRVVSPFAQAAGLITRYQQGKMGLDSLEQQLAAPDELSTGRSHLHRPIERGELRLAGVEFSYPDTELPAVSKLDLLIKPGSRVGIIGRTGSGKSTLARLMMGLYHPSSGNLLVDGVEIRQRHPMDLRRGIGYLAQDARLVSGSIRDNIAFGLGDISDAQVIEAAEAAGLSAFTDVDASGLSRRVGEGGQMLSRGQRQLVALARALVLRPRVLILDEPTASLDPATEQLVRQSLARLPRDITLVLVTHKQTMLEVVDNLVVMDHGRMLRHGAKLEVMNWLKQGGANG